VKLEGVTSTPYFPAEASPFLRDLAANNNREHFTANRATYDRAIRGPLEDLTGAAQEKYGPGKVMRPNRDVRFSTDKSPYRTDASMWAGSVGGVYLRLSVDGIEAGGVLYEPTRDQLSRAREAIAAQPLAATRLAAVLAELRSSGYDEAGPALKTAPKGYGRDDPNIELLRLKHYAAVRSLPITASRADIDEAWKAVEPLIAWAEEYIGPALSWP
jgi:uncharacterized protein (TIGR02453 family)